LNQALWPDARSMKTLIISAFKMPGSETGMAAEGQGVVHRLLCNMDVTYANPRTS
jgi:hypothetical protein